MRITIDGSGRLVVPKALREELGITGVTELEILARDGTIELAVLDAPGWVDVSGGLPVIMTDAPMPPLGVEEVRDAIDRVRR